MNFLDAVQFYETAKAGLGEKFRLAVNAAAKEIGRKPSFWRRLRGNYRRCLVSDFPFGLIYINDEEKVYIVAVMHLRRGPGYWAKRLRDTKKKGR
ncbi:MAG: type II toxin-antitoxin system RelE/ParE family toxin [Candidatus Sumerlaeaceae bacterium]